MGGQTAEVLSADKGLIVERDRRFTGGEDAKGWIREHFSMKELSHCLGGQSAAKAGCESTVTPLL